MANGSEITELTRSQKMAAALNSYARNLTFENRSRRNLYKLAGIAPKLRDKVFSYLILAAFIVYFVIPISSSVIYFGFIATPQYESEIRFIVRSSVPLLTRDRYASGNAEPKAKIVQDTAVILNYLASPAVIEDLAAEIDLRRYFGRREIDYLSRLAPNATQEEVLDYWEGQYTSSVNPKSGIVELSVRAFSGEEAYNLLLTVVNLAEQRVNRLNTAMWENLTVASQQDLDTATLELERLRTEMRDRQNEYGIFDVDLAANSLIDILTNVRTELAKVQTQRLSLIESISPESPRIELLDKKIAALEFQAKLLESKATGSGVAEDANLAGVSKKFQQLNLDIELAEDRLKSAVGELEKAKLVGTLQLVYIDAFTTPTKPIESSYPKTWLMLLLSFLGFSALWGSATGILIYIRNKLD